MRKRLDGCGVAEVDPAAGHQRGAGVGVVEQQRRELERQQRVDVGERVVVEPQPERVDQA